jgi:hypothetical protein
MTVEIAGITIGIYDQTGAPLPVNPAYTQFTTERDPEVVIHSSNDGLPDIPLRDEDRVFDTEMTWQLYHVDGQHVITMSSPVAGPQPYGIAVFSDDFRQGTVYNRPVRLETKPDPFVQHPLSYPLDEVLLVSLLARERGLLMHACAIDVDGRGYLFAGNSTHGKTTMARLWQSQARVLNDDRIALRRGEDGRVWLYCTPWHGELEDITLKPVPLEKLFFLRHAPENTLTLRTGAAAASMLLARCFPPLWDAAGMTYTLDFSGQIVSEVPCYELGFLPDETVIDCVRGAA